MKKITQALIIATFLTSIPLTGILVNHYHSPAKDSLTNHQVETNLKAPELQIADPTYELKLTPFNNPTGVNDSGLIMLSLDIDQEVTEQVSEVNVGIDIEDDTTIWTKIYNGGFTDVTELNLSYGFTELANKIYTIDVVIKLKNSDSLEIALSKQVEITNEEQTTLIVNKDSMVIVPTKNKDGTITYKEGAIEVYLTTAQRAFDPTKVDATNGMMRILYANTPPQTIEIDYDQDLAKATSKDEVTIPEQIVKRGYSIVLTGMMYDSAPINLIEVATIDGTNDSMGVWTIVGIVIGSLAGVALLGAGGYWIIKD